MGIDAFIWISNETNQKNILLDHSLNVGTAVRIMTIHFDIFMPSDMKPLICLIFTISKKSDLDIYASLFSIMLSNPKVNIYIIGDDNFQMEKADLSNVISIFFNAHTRSFVFKTIYAS